MSKECEHDWNHSEGSGWFEAFDINISNPVFLTVLFQWVVHEQYYCKKCAEVEVMEHSDSIMDCHFERVLLPMSQVSSVEISASEVYIYGEFPGCRLGSNANGHIFLKIRNEFQERLHSKILGFSSAEAYASLL